MKKIIILFDVEGVIGVYSLSNSKDVKRLVDIECKMLFDELSKLSNYKIFFCDCHNRGEYTVSLKYKYPNIIFYNSIWDIDFNEDFDYAVLSGFHAMSGAKSVLSHTFRDDIKKMYIGKKEIGEIEFFINLLAYYNVMPIYVSGCSATLKEISYVDCVKNCSKNELFTYNIEKYYQMYRENLKYLVDMLNAEYINIKKNYYNGKEIKIELIREEMQDYIDVLNYRDSIDFFVHLPKLCVELNEYWNQIQSAIVELKQIINTNSISRDDVESMTILKKNIKNITLSDIDILKNKLYKIIEDKRKC